MAGLVPVQQLLGLIFGTHFFLKTKRDIFHGDQYCHLVDDGFPMRGLASPSRKNLSLIPPSMGEHSIRTKPLLIRSSMEDDFQALSSVIQ